MSRKDNIRRDLELRGENYFAENYQKPTTSNYLRQLRWQYIQEWLNQVPSRTRILDLGCGPEILFKDSVARAEEYVAVDLVEANIRKLREGPRAANVTLVEADLDSFEWKQDYFDAIVCSGVLEYTENPEKNLLRLFGYLKTGGILICSLPNGYSPYRVWSEHVYRHLWWIKNRLIGREVHHYPRRLFSKSKIVRSLVQEPGRWDVTVKYFGHKFLLQPLDILLKQLDNSLTRHFEGSPFILSKIVCTEFLLRILKCERYDRL
jgi:2-polyprenyl-3-methyl-5-hydroxy-6-metoxy-1,4-benzoquinol methylase